MSRHGNSGLPGNRRSARDHRECRNGCCAADGHFDNLIPGIQLGDNHVGGEIPISAGSWGWVREDRNAPNGYPGHLRGRVKVVAG